MLLHLAGHVGQDPLGLVAVHRRGRAAQARNVLPCLPAQVLRAAPDPRRPHAASLVQDAAAETLARPVRLQGLLAIATLLRLACVGDRLARALEERGFESVWVAEHVVLFDEYASRYPYAADGRIPAGGESGIFEPFTASRGAARAASGLGADRGPKYCVINSLSSCRLVNEFSSPTFDCPTQSRRTSNPRWLSVKHGIVAPPSADHAAGECGRVVMPTLAGVARHRGTARRTS